MGSAGAVGRPGPRRRDEERGGRTRSPGLVGGAAGGARSRGRRRCGGVPRWLAGTAAARTGVDGCQGARSAGRAGLDRASRGARAPGALRGGLVGGLHPARPRRRLRVRGVGAVSGVTLVDVAFWVFGAGRVLAAWLLFRFDSMFRAAYWRFASFACAGAWLLSLNSRILRLFPVRDMACR